MPFPYLGSSTRVYGQYLNDATGGVLVAEPGGEYDMTPVEPDAGLSVPPGDGQWPAPPDPGPPPQDPPADNSAADSGRKAPLVPPAMASGSNEDGE